MINFLSNWIEQITMAVIIVSVFELILPNGNLKKYIKVVLGIYVIFCIISPFVNRSNLYQIGDIDLKDYIQNTTQSETAVNQESMDLRLQELYREELKNNIQKKVEENGYKLYKCDIEADLKSSSDNPGIHKIDLVITENKNNIGDIEKIEIGFKEKDEITDNKKVETLKENLANYYEVNKEIINIKIK